MINVYGFPLCPLKNQGIAVLPEASLLGSSLKFANTTWSIVAKNKVHSRINRIIVFSSSYLEFYNECLTGSVKVRVITMLGRVGREKNQSFPQRAKK